MRRLTVAVVVTLAALLAGCTNAADPGIPSADGGAGPSASATADLLDLMGQWAQCMRDHGVDMPDPYLDPETGKYTFNYEGPGKGEPGAEANLAAQEACLEYETAYQEFGDPTPMSEEQLRLFREWAQCMRDHGVDQPDPGPYGFEDGPADENPRAEDPQAAVKEQAEAACFDKFLEARMAGA